MASYPTTVYDIGIAYDANGGTIYGLGGSGSTGFYQYNISSNSWTSKAVPGAYLAGFGVGLNGKVWYFGNDASKMRYYDPTSNTWTVRTATNSIMPSQDAVLINDGTNNLYGYAANGSNTTFRYQTR
jgi:hypothetical protein